MRKIAATYVFPGNSTPIKNGVVVCEDDGTVIDILEKGDNFKEEAGTEFYSGILLPGFVNVHCHLELSHLKGKIDERTGIAGFIGEINKLREVDSLEQERLMAIADRKMWSAGISAVGDISNSNSSIPTKLKSKINYHTFVETFGFHPSRAEKSFSYTTEVYNAFSKNGLKASVVPHSPYSVSDELFFKIKTFAEQSGGIISVHNQESMGEEEFYVRGTGPVAEHLTSNLGIDISHWKPTGKSSLQSILKHIPEKNNLLLVHNTFTEADDLDILFSQRSSEKTWFVLCPNSNLYIENELPPVNLFRDRKVNICMGTDSLASNHELSILKEMLTIQQHFKDVNLHELVKWACLNGAKALRLDHVAGSIEKGKKPGINLISGVDFTKMKFTEQAKVKRLV